jgi:CspA family cold shock protein
LSQRLTGTVKSFDPSKGYGYIDAGLGEDVFVYYQDITGNGFPGPARTGKNLIAGNQVEFSITRKPSGPVAQEVRRI